MNERLFSSRMLFSRDSSTRCSPNVKRRDIATRACGTEEPARRVRVPSASLTSMCISFPMRAKRTRSKIKLHV